MNAKKYEKQFLTELLAMHEAPESSGAKYRKISLVLMVFGFIFAFTLQHFSEEAVNYMNIYIAGLVISGIFIGIGFYYNQACNQVALLTKYTDINSNLIKQRLLELSNESIGK